MNNKLVIESFWQTGYNCATVAVIKAAIIKYGIDKVFKLEQRNPYKIITLRNRQMILLSGTEIKAINKKNHIAFDEHCSQKLKSYVELCFAVMVKSLQEYYIQEYGELEKNEAGKTLLDGYNVEEASELLGLQMKTKKANDLRRRHLADLRKKKAVLFYNDYHAVVLSGGLWDCDGDPIELGDAIPLLRENGERAAYWFELK